MSIKGGNHMEQMVNVFLFGKKYEVPASLTIMEAMEYAGYQLVRGCGCRNGAQADSLRTPWPQIGRAHV